MPISVDSAFLTSLHCLRCGVEYAPTAVEYVCACRPNQGSDLGTLDAQYDYAAIHQAINDAATIGSVVFLQLLLTQALAPVPALSGILQTYLNARASLGELGQPFAAPINPVERPDARPCPELRGELELRGVNFCYPGTDKSVLRDVDLHIAVGEVVALVGPTGAGKSTLAKVIARLYDPDTGTASVDGIDLREIDLRSYRARLGVVPQDAFCFSGTVAGNITYGRPDASPDAVAKAIEDCGGAALLTMIPDGLETEVTEEGANLPPLARQWIALARMWLVEPDVLVLDEATSGLPADDEQRVMDALRQTGRTSVVVTHRLEVARRADRIAVVNNGVISEHGTHAELLAAGGLYTAMCAHGKEADGAGASDAAHR